MTESSFFAAYRDRTGVKLGDGAIFKQHGRWIVIDGEEQRTYKKANDVLTDRIGGVLISTLIKKLTQIPATAGYTVKGDRNGQERRKAFGNAADGGGSREARRDFPARLNTGGRFQSNESTLQLFTDRFVNDRIEHGITVDEQGFVTQLIHGGATSVSISGRRGELVIHNHPASGNGEGGSFSLADLQSTAMERSRGIVAVAPEAIYTFTKGPNFDAAGFYRAVGNATVPANLTYNEGVQRWMSRNAKRYGFTYTVQSRG